MQPGQRTTGRYQLIDGPWEHLNGSSVDVDPLELEWFDTWLKHEHTGMARTPHPAALLRPGQRRSSRDDDVSVHRGEAHALYLGPAGPHARAAAKPSPPTADRPSDHRPGAPREPCAARPVDQWSMGGISIPAHSAGLLAPCADNDQPSQAGPWTTSYTSAPFPRPQTVAGPITATIYASSTTPETELVAELEDVTPSGASYPLTEGALLGSLRAVDRARSWTAHGMTLLPYHPYTKASAQPVRPGAVTEYQIEVFPTLATIAAGTGCG